MVRSGASLPAPAPPPRAPAPPARPPPPWALPTVVLDRAPSATMAITVTHCSVRELKTCLPGMCGAPLSAGLTRRRRNRHRLHLVHVFGVHRLGAPACRLHRQRVLRGELVQVRVLADQMVRHVGGVAARHLV